jgi:hypothetical protein
VKRLARWQRGERSSLIPGLALRGLSGRGRRDWLGCWRGRCCPLPASGPRHPCGAASRPPCQEAVSGGVCPPDWRLAASLVGVRAWVGDAVVAGRDPDGVGAGRDAGLVDPGGRGVAGSAGPSSAASVSPVDAAAGALAARVGQACAGVLGRGGVQPGACVGLVARDEPPGAAFAGVVVASPAGAARSVGHPCERGPARRVAAARKDPLASGWSGRAGRFA